MNTISKIHIALVHFPFGIILLYYLFCCFQIFPVSKKNLKKLIFILFFFTGVTGVLLSLDIGFKKPYMWIHYILGSATVLYVIFAILLRRHFSDKFTVILVAMTVVAAFVPEVLTRGFYNYYRVDKKVVEKKNIEYNDSYLYYEKVVKPIFNNRCLSCHSGHRHEREFSIARLEQLQTDYFYKFISPGVPSKSLLYKLITKPSFSKYHMPYNSGHLENDEIDAIAKWIKMGAFKAKSSDGVYPHGNDGNYVVQDKVLNHWSLHSFKKPEINEGVNGVNPIDSLVSKISEEYGHKINLKPLSRDQLLRRLSFALTGLFPSKKTTVKFLRKKKTYQNVTEELIASHHFGQHFAMFWYDFAGLADMPYLDDGEDLVIGGPSIVYKRYVIDSFNQDESYRQFYLKQFLKSDSFWETSQDSLNIIRYQPQIEVDNHSSAFMNLNNIYSFSLGIDMKCARCHDHPYAPISKVDYYNQLAFFDKSHRLKDGPSNNNPFFSERDVNPRFLSIFEQERAIVKEMSDWGLRELSDYLQDEKNELHLISIRVYVNGLWAFIMGKGIVEETGDFFKVNKKPPFIELLNFLTYYFIENDYSTKKLVRLIVMSKLFQAKEALPDSIAISKTKNIEHELVRDNLLKILGKLYTHDTNPVAPQDVVLKWDDEAERGGGVQKSSPAFIEWSEKKFRTFLYPRFRSESKLKKMGLKIPRGLNSIARRKYTPDASELFYFFGDEVFSGAIQYFSEKFLSKKYFSHEILSEVYLNFFLRYPTNDEFQVWTEFFDGEITEGKKDIFFRVLISSHEFNFVR